MNNAKKLYIVEWSQDYAEWEEWLERIIEANVESSGMKDAKAVLKQVMEM